MSRETPAVIDPAVSDAGRSAPAGPRWFWPACVGICLAAGAVRLWVLAEHVAENPFYEYLRADSLTYWDWAGHIAGGELVGKQPFFSAPLYPYLLGLIRAAGGGLTTVLVLQIVVDLVTAGLLAGIGRARFGWGAGLLATVLYLGLRDPASYCLRILPATLALLLVAVTWLALLSAQRRATLLRTAFAGFSLGLLALSWAPAILFIPVGAAWLWWARLGERRALGMAALVLAAGMLTVSPATIHNLAACGEFIPISAQSGVTFSHGNAPGATGCYTPLPGISTDRAYQNQDVMRVYQRETGGPASWRAANRYFFQRGLAYWRAEPLRAAGLFARKAYWFLTGCNYGDVVTPALEIRAGFLDRLRFAPLQPAWLIPPALVAAATWLRRSRTFLPELMFLLVPFAIVVVFWYSPRYRLPAVPVFVVGAAYLVVQAVRRPVRPGWVVAGLAAVAVWLALAVVNRAIGFDAVANYEAEFACSVGTARLSTGQFTEAADEFRRAVELNPRLIDAEIGWADALRRGGDPAAALPHARHAVELSSGSAAANNMLGVVIMAATRDAANAEPHFRRALECDPGFAEAYSNLGNVLHAQGRYAEAVEQYQRALQLAPERASVHFNLGVTQMRLGQAASAQQSFRACLDRDPRFNAARTRLADLFISTGRYADAAAQLDAACADEPSNIGVVNDLAWLLATCTDPAVRDGRRAVQLAERACAATDAPPAALLDTLAAAQAESGDFAAAADTARRAIAAATAAGDTALADRVRQRRACYEAQRPYHEEQQP